MTGKPEQMTETPDPEPVAPALDKLRLEGAIFLRGEYSEAWAFESVQAEMAAAILHPGAERVILFHVVANGRCFISTDGEPHWADTGDIIVLPYGDQHVMGGVEPVDPVAMASLISPPPWSELPVVRHGSGGGRTDIVCGYLYSEDPLFDPALRALPSVFVVRPPDEATKQWVGASFEYAVAGGGDQGSTRLSELLLTEALKLHLGSAPAADHGLMAALRDPVLAPALGLLHGEPDRHWTVADLAGQVAVSRSVLDQRFRQVLGRSPIRYLADWRMHLADDLLAETKSNVGAIAREVGYESEEAFSRAFKRARGLSPAAWRATRQG
ncbi:MAG TPA: AraC family transcriptional regulator [Acidimicrobiales bacterium]|nr:AraC family transcriptional regulator [Acidimicrobiales bacterium]